MHPDDPRIAGCRHVVFHAPGRDGADARNATVDPPRLARPLAVRHGHLGAHGALHARGELALGEPFVNESRDRHPVHRAAGRGDAGRRPAGRGARRSPAARGSRGRAATCSTPTTRSPPASRCEAHTRSRSSARGSSAPRRRASSRSAASTSSCSTPATCPAAPPGSARATCLLGQGTPGRTLELSRGGLELYAELEERLGAAARIRRKGALIVHPDEATWAAEPARLERLSAAGVASQAVAADEVRELEPALTGALCGATPVPRRPQCDRARSRARWPVRRPRLAREVQTGARVTAVSGAGVVLATGERIVAGAVVIAAGPWSAPLAESAGRARSRSSRARASSCACSPPPVRRRSATRSSTARTSHRCRARRRACRSPPSSRRRGTATCSWARAASGAGSTRRSTTP